MDKSVDALDGSTEGPGGLSRRDALRRGALVVGATVWATPVVQSIGPYAWAHGSGGGVICDHGKPCAHLTLTMQYTGSSCGASNNNQFGSATCTDYGAQKAPIKVQVSKNSGFTQLLANHYISPGGTFSISGLGTDTYYRVLCGTSVRQKGHFVTSCYKRLSVADQFGALKIVGFTGDCTGHHPGTDKPGTGKPGTDKPGTGKPGTDKPGSDKPGYDDKKKKEDDKKKEDAKKKDDGKKH